MAVKMWIMVFWVVTPYTLVGGYQNFGDMNCLYFQSKCQTTEQYVTLKYC
jgi:hypothetical protein